MAKVELRDSLVWVNSEDRTGRLIYFADRLVGVLVELTATDGAEGKWFLEAGFGPLSSLKPHPMFEDLVQAERWISDRIDGASPGGLTGRLIYRTGE